MGAYTGAARRRVHLATVLPQSPRQTPGPDFAISGHVIQKTSDYFETSHADTRHWPAHYLSLRLFNCRSCDPAMRSKHQNNYVLWQHRISIAVPLLTLLYQSVVVCPSLPQMKERASARRYQHHVQTNRPWHYCTDYTRMYRHAWGLDQDMEGLKYFISHQAL